MLPIAAVVSSPDGTKRRRIGSRGSWSEMLHEGGGGQMIFRVRDQCMLALFGVTSYASMEVTMDFVR